MNSAQDVNTETFPPPATNMFLAYDTAETGRNALALLDHVAARLNNTAAFNAKLWRFDLITLSECTPQADADAADADVMVVAFGADDPVPPGLFQWLGGWAEHRHIKDAALGVLPTGAATPSVGLTAVAALRGLALSHGLEFICRDEPMKGGDLASLVRRPDRGNAPPPPPLISPSQNIPFSEWGIND